MSATTFAGLGVSKVTTDALRKEAITEPFAVQTLVLPDALEGRDLLVRSPTGSGKTLAFGVPLLERVDANGPKQAALVLAPTRELVSQIVEALRPVAHARALGIASIYGGVGFGPQEKRARTAHVLVATPGRLEDLIRRGTVRLDRVGMLVLDEADRMLDMGFKPVVDRICRAMPRERQTLLFSATLDERVRRIADDLLRDPVTHEHGDARPGVSASDIEHRFVRVEHTAKLDRLVRELGNPERGRTLVFVRTKRGADRLVKRLGTHEVTAVAMHGDKTQGQRERALRSFEDGRVDTLVATDVAARGIDVADVTHVINFDAPEDREAYVHRIGRTARAGATGVGITFFMDDQASDIAAIANGLGLEREFGGDAPGIAPRRKGDRTREQRGARKAAKPPKGSIRGGAAPAREERGSRGAGPKPHGARPDGPRSNRRNRSKRAAS